MADRQKGRYRAHGDFSPSLPAYGPEPEAESSDPQLLPPWRVVLHNDDVHGIDEAVEAIHLVTLLSRELALARLREVHDQGAAILLITHRERAELYVQQFQAYQLTVTIEPAV